MRQLITGRWKGDSDGFAETGQFGANHYGVLGGSSRFARLNTTTVVRQWPIPAAGRFENFFVELGQSPDACGVDSFTFRFQIAEISTAAVIEITGTNTTGSYTGAGIDVEVGDLVRWAMVPDPASGAFNLSLPEISSSVEFVSDEPKVSIYYGIGVDGAQSDTGAWVNGLFNPTDDWSSSNNLHRSVITVKGTITRYDLLLDEAPDVDGTSCTFAIVIDGVVQDGSGGTVDTRTTLTTESTATWTGSLSIDPDTQQTAWVQLTGTGFAANMPRVSYSIKFEANSDGEFWLGGYNGAHPDNSTAEYMIPTANGVDAIWTTGEALGKRILTGANAFTLTGIRMWMAVAPSSGRSWTFQTMYDGVATGPTATLADANTIATGSGSLTLESGHHWSLRSTPSNTPVDTTDGIAWAFLATTVVVVPPIPGSNVPTVPGLTGSSSPTVTGLSASFSGELRCPHGSVSSVLFSGSYITSLPGLQGVED